MLLVVCQLNRDVIVLGRLEASLVCFDPSIVTVKKSFIVSQIVSWKLSKIVRDCCKFT